MTPPNRFVTCETRTWAVSGTRSSQRDAPSSQDREDQKRARGGGGGRRGSGPAPRGPSRSPRSTSQPEKSAKTAETAAATLLKTSVLRSASPFVPLKTYWKCSVVN